MDGISAGQYEVNETYRLLESGALKVEVLQNQKQMEHIIIKHQLLGKMHKIQQRIMIIKLVMIQHHGY